MSGYEKKVMNIIKRNSIRKYQRENGCKVDKKKSNWGMGRKYIR